MVITARLRLGDDYSESVRYRPRRAEELGSKFARNRFLIKLPDRVYAFITGLSVWDRRTLRMYPRGTTTTTINSAVRDGPAEKLWLRESLDSGPAYDSAGAFLENGVLWSLYSVLIIHSFLKKALARRLRFFIIFIIYSSHNGSFVLRTGNAWLLSNSTSAVLRRVVGGQTAIICGAFMR